jgi:LPS sulfotransferase NodH
MNLNFDLVKIWEGLFGSRISRELEALWRIRQQYGEEYAGDWLLQQHYAAIAEELKLEYPQLQRETIPVAMLPVIIKKAIRILLRRMA